MKGEKNNRQHLKATKPTTNTITIKTQNFSFLDSIVEITSQNLTKLLPQR